MNTDDIIFMLKTRSARLRDILARVESMAGHIKEVRLAPADFDYLADEWARETGGRFRLSDARPFGAHIMRHNPDQRSLL